MRKEVELLKHHAHLAGNAARIVLADIFRTAGSLAAQHLTINRNAALVNSLQLIQATQQRTLAAAGRSDNSDNLALIDLQVDTL